MKSSFLCLLAAVTAGWAQAGEPASAFRLNTLGYLPDAPKKATLAAPSSEFSVLRVSDGKVVLSGTASRVQDPDTKEEVAVLDFSALKQPGEYRLQAGAAGESPVFKVDADLYREPLGLVTRAMYLWRCGVAVEGEWNGRTFRHAPCHTEDAWLDHVTGKHERRDSTGGWHDAGDYNKYVTNAGVTVGVMLRAWEDFEPALRGIGLKLPESGGALPDYLAEIKFETDWLFTMQEEDGSVYHKVSTEYFGAFVLPEKETTPRYFCPGGSVSEANFVGMMAQASRAFRPYLPEYADRCLAAARKTYAHLQANPAARPADQVKFHTGGYDSSDGDERLWAAAEVWEATGDAAALKDFEARLRELQPTFEEDFDWAALKNLGLFTYFFSKREGRDAVLVAALRENLRAVSDDIVAKAKEHGYGRTLGKRYYWGCNGGVARQTLLLQSAYRVFGDKIYRETALDAVNHLFGRNVDGRSYVTGLGFKPPMNPHDRRAGGDTVDEPWPGYLVGGAHPGARDWQDIEADARTNEIAINWNGALIYALAGFLEKP